MGTEYTDYTMKVIDGLFGGLGDMRSAQAEEAYEEKLIAEAREIVAGAGDLEPTPEHLRIVLSRMDQYTAEAMDAESVPF